MYENYLIKAALVVTTIGFILTTLLLLNQKPIFLTEPKDIEMLEAYSDYYFYTEQMLDSLGINHTSKIFEEGCGEAYYDAKYTLDSLIYTR